MADTTTQPASATAQVMASPLYRGATIAMFLSGLATSMAAPQIVLFLVNELGASLPVGGLYYLTSLAAPVAGYLVGSYSDRTGERMGLFRLCALAGFIGWGAIALSSQVWMPFVVSALVLGFSGAATSQLFAAVRDDLDRSGGAASEGVVAIIRMALTAGWVVGPVAGAWLAAEAGMRTMLWATAIFTLLQIVPLGMLRVASPARAAETPAGGAADARPGLGAMLPLLAFTGLYVLVYAGESVKYGFLPVYMAEQLKLDPAVRGAVIGIQPLIELIIMPFSVMIGRRMGMMWLMCLGAGFGVLANLCFATTGSAAGMFAGQICMGAVWGIFAALGIIVAQRLLPNAVATASAIFMSSTAVASALGGITGGLGVAAIGLPTVFVIPAAFAGMAVVGLAVMARSRSVGPMR